MANKKNREIFWSNHVELWKTSKLTQVEYCRQNKVDEQLFSKWKIRLSGSKDKNKFVEVPKKQLNQFLITDEIELVIKDQYKIKVHSSFNPETLKKILSAFEDMK